MSLKLPFEMAVYLPTYHGCSSGKIVTDTRVVRKGRYTHAEKGRQEGEWEEDECDPVTKYQFNLAVLVYQRETLREI